MGRSMSTPTFNKHSGIYTLQTEQTVNLSIAAAWDFFSSPKNLQKLTPSHMGFTITSTVGEKLYPGQIITYKINILPGIKSSWVSEITQVKDQHFFIDEQRFGPYAMWHHEHWFESVADDKTIVKDRISYKLPLGPLGHLAQELFVKKQLKQIFNYRFTALTSLFNNP
jgi:ligand-binding SRPBCC domain-containing protein